MNTKNLTSYFYKFILSVCIFFNVQTNKAQTVQTVDKIKMDLSAFGVESDEFPNIYAIIDLKNDTSYCEVSYYSPKYPKSTYRLTKSVIDSIKSLIYNSDIRKLKKNYKTQYLDQPTSTTIFYLNNDKKIEVKDYGLKGDYPLNELYRFVYQLEKNIRK